MTDANLTNQNSPRNGTSYGAKPVALPQSRALWGMLYSFEKLASDVQTLMYNCWPRYCLAHIADRTFHIPWLSNDTKIADHPLGYTYRNARTTSELDDHGIAEREQAEIENVVHSPAQCVWLRHPLSCMFVWDYLSIAQHRICSLSNNQNVQLCEIGALVIFWYGWVQNHQNSWILSGHSCRKQGTLVCYNS